MRSKLIVLFITALTSSLLFADPAGDAEAKFRAADKALNTIYTQARVKMEKDAFSELQAEQRLWVTWRNSWANFARRDTPKVATVDYWNAMADFTELRSDMIRAWLEAKPDLDRWVGTYRDFAGGGLTITKKGDVYFFNIGVVRGPTSHLGQVDGKLEVNRNRARFTDKEIFGPKPAGTPPEDIDEELEANNKALGITWLDFEKMGDGIRIKVTGTNTSKYHGLRAYFSGIYIRVK